MTQTLELLRSEHQTMHKLLNILELQLDRIEKNKSVDLFLIGEVIGYFRSFPDMHHHPKEDLIFEALEKKAPEVIEAMGDLEKKHEELSNQLHEFTRLVIKYLLKPERWQERFIKKARKFIADERLHIVSEEQKFFPQALKYLDSEDWEEIDSQVGVFTDPLIFEAEQGRFAEIMKYLNNDADAENITIASQ